MGLRGPGLATLVALAALTAACGGESRRRETLCEPGASRPCDCASGLTGEERCAEDGESWGSCVCGAADGDVDGDVDTDVDGDTDGDTDTDTDSDADADYDVDVDWDEEPPPVTRVDLLFVIDNSNSMEEEQAELNRQFWPLLRELLEPTRDPVTGLVAPAVTDVHVGVVSTDLGTLGYTVASCDALEGDEGILQNEGRREGCLDRYSALDCPRADCPWLSHSTALPDDGTDPTNPPIWEDFPCISTLGTGGCGFEQQLESSLLALTTQAEPGGPNEGFLRSDSLLAVIYVSDEDDCSTGNPETFNPSRDDLGPLNLRCGFHEELLYPIERYFAGLVRLRDHVGHLVVAAITGLPTDGSWELGDPIEDLRALRRVDPADPNTLLPSCEDPDMGRAYPPVRFAELAAMFRQYGYMASICEKSWATAQRDIARMIQRRLASS